jgi:hypothetical protein
MNYLIVMIYLIKIIGEIFLIIELNICLKIYEMLEDL